MQASDLLRPPKVSEGPLRPPAALAAVLPQYPTGCAPRYEQERVEKRDPLQSLMCYAMLRLYLFGLQSR